MPGKKDLTEQQIREQYIDPHLDLAGWKLDVNLGVEVRLTPGPVVVQGAGSIRGEERRADYVLYARPGLPIAVVEAKDNKHTVRAGLQQALAYAEMIDAPFAFSSNGDAFFEHDRTGTRTLVEDEIPLISFPTEDVSTTHYFGDAEDTYSLLTGIDDGFLAPYKVVRIDLDRDIQGWLPRLGQRDRRVPRMTEAATGPSGGASEAYSKRGKRGRSSSIFEVTSSRGPLQSPEPVARAALRVGHGEHYDAGRLGDVSQRVREP